MDGAYLDRRNDNRSGLYIIIIIIILVVLAGGIFFIISGRKSIISPIPKESAVEVIFYTPTPGITASVSTPSATPKVKKTPTNTPKPEKSTVTPAKSTISPSPKTTVSPTVKPTT